MTPSRPRLQYVLPKINTMASCPSRIHHQLVSSFASNPRHHALPNVSAFICGTVLLPNDDVPPTADASTECFEENLLSNGVLLPNSAHMSVSSLYQFLVLTGGYRTCRCMKQRQVPAAISNGDSLLLLIKFETVIYFQKIVEKNIKRICGWHILQPTGKKCRVWSRLLCSCTSCWEI
jgi:hypothetical protein